LRKGDGSRGKQSEHRFLKAVTHFEKHNGVGYRDFRADGAVRNLK